MASVTRALAPSSGFRLLVAMLLLACLGCSQRNRANVPAPPPRVVAVAPVLNLSGTEDFDPLKLTDLIASEFVSFDNVAVIPVNLTLAELERHGMVAVETPEDALELARALGADATVVTAVTEYNPYYPPVVGMVMQWYGVRPSTSGTRLDPVTASRLAADLPWQLSDGGGAAPLRQVQCVFNASHDGVLKDVRRYAERRSGEKSPYGWRKYLRSQELYVRYCGWAMIRTMLMLDDESNTDPVPHEAKS